MRLTIYGKNITTKNGNSFIKYTSRITDKSGKEYPVQVKFKKSCTKLTSDLLPCVIEVGKDECSLATEHYTSNEEDRIAYTLWLSGYKVTDEAVVDHSMDEFF